ADYVFPAPAMDVESARQLDAPLAAEPSNEAFQGNCISRSFLTWVFPLCRRSADVEQLQVSDLFEVEADARPEVQVKSFLERWRAKVGSLPGRQRRRSGWLLLRVLGALHIPRLRWYWMLRLMQAFLDFSFPLFLNLLVKFVEQDNAPVWQGLLLSLALFSSESLCALVDAAASVGLQAIGLRIRASLVSAIFRKVLLLRQDSMLSFSTGKLNNMITTDVDKARRALRYLHVLLLTAPLKIFISLWSLHSLVGPSVFIGLSWMGVVILLNPAMMYIMNRLEDRQQATTDERVRKVTEVISSINVIKCYGWEEPATAKVEEARSAELLALWRLYCLYTVFEGLWSSIVPCCTALMFASYTWLNPEKPLTPAQAFTAISLLSMVQDPLFTIPWVLNLIIEAFVAAKRIEGLFWLTESQLPAISALGTFLPSAQEEHHRRASMASMVPPLKLDTGSAIRLDHASFAWKDEESEEGSRNPESMEQGERRGDFQLEDLTLHVQKGSLVAVVGPTGSGKSSFLQALLGEMPKKEGSGKVEVSRTKPIAFVPQQPWVFNATIRQNILFGEPYSEIHYKDCLRSCDLEEDLKNLQAGDQTRVGEKGIALSGGQKARICLARAAYRMRDSNIYLLDDPYSALDSRVAWRCHEALVTGLLARKTRVVAMNRLEFLSSCDQVVVMSNGQIEAAGRYQEVVQSSTVLQALLKSQGLAERAQAQAELPCSSPPTFSRALSASSGGSAPDGHHEEEEEDDEEAEGVEEEERATGQIKKEVFVYYLRAMGGCCRVSLLSSLYIGSEAVTLCLPVWLAVWTAASTGASEVSLDLTMYYLSIYVILSVLVIVLATLRDLAGNVYGFMAARRLHLAMWTSVLRAPMSFFQDTPQGRIINRFSKDMSEIDKDVVWTVINTFVPVLGVLGNFAMVGGIAYYSVIAFLPAFFFYYKLWKYYNKAVLDVKRISKVQGSHVYDHFNNLCRENAISVVRAFRQAEQQCRMSDGFIVDQQRPDYTQMFLSQWFSLRIELLGSILTLLVSVFITLGREGLVSPSKAALVLNFAGECTGSIEQLIGQVAEFSMAFNCVERVRHYAEELPSEAPAVTELRPPPGWPNRGVLQVKDLQLRYKPHLPLVLKGLTFTMKEGERVGVVGRTGAGKSSLLLALLRIAEPEPGSSIELDGQDVLQMGLQDLRRAVAMIPQEPVLFQETLRYNCDPFDQHSAEAIWDALREAQLASWVRRRGGEEADPAREEDDVDYEDRGTNPPASQLQKLLSLEIKENGQNLSAGQRQMVAIARAVLRSSKLVVLDEATAAVDASTDEALQKAIRRCFTGASSLTIAHRLQTIIDCERILVLAEGKIAEFDSPKVLRADERGVFRSMLDEVEHA
ncbi:ABCC2, partial [Symbiodinium natans]